MIATSARPDLRHEASLAGVRVLVFGGTGFIGRWLVQALASRGALVHVTTRDAATARETLAPYAAVAEIIGADLTQPGSLRRAIDRASPAVAFNLAVHGVDHRERDGSVMAALNAGFAMALCAEIAAHISSDWPGLRLVHVGSALEYGHVSGRLREDVTPNPTTDYGRSKLQATEHIVAHSRQTGLRSIVARLFTVYGPGEQPGRLLPSLVHAARTGTALRLTSGHQQRDFTYVEDVVEGLLRLAVSAAPPGTIVNLATGHLRSVREFAETAAEIMGIDPQALQFGALPVRPEEMQPAAVDIDRLESLTGWKPPTGLAEGIRRSWERSHGAI